MNVITRGLIARYLITCLITRYGNHVTSQIDDEYQDEFGEEEDHEEEDIEYSTINSNDPKYESDADTQRIGSISKFIQHILYTIKF